MSNSAILSNSLFSFDIPSLNLGENFQPLDDLYQTPGSFTAEPLENISLFQTNILPTFVEDEEKIWTSAQSSSSKSSLDAKRFSLAKSTFTQPSSSKEKDSTDKAEDRLLQDLDAWEKSFKQLLSGKEIDFEDHKKVFEFIKNANHCREEFQTYCENFVSSEQLDLIFDYLDLGYTTCKTIKPLDQALQQTVKWFALEQANKELKQISNRYQNQLEAKELEKCGNRLTQCFEEVKVEQQKSLQESTIQLAKVTAYQIIPYKLSSMIGLSSKNAQKGCKLAVDMQKNISYAGEIWKGFKIDKEWTDRLQSGIKVDFHFNKVAHQKLNDEIEAFLTSLEECQNAAEVKRLLKKVKIDLEVPAKIEDWKRELRNDKLRAFLSQRYQAYNQNYLFYNTEKTQELLNKRQQASHHNMVIGLRKLRPALASFDDLSFEEIKVKLKENSIDLSRIEGAPTNKEEWNAQLADPDSGLIIFLCKQWVDHQEALILLAEQGLRASILTKIQVEKRLLAFRGIEQIIGIALIGLRIGLYLPGFKTGLERYFLNYFVSNLPIPGLGLLTIFISDRDLTLDGLFTFAISHCVGSYYKPNEYSWEGYQVDFRLKWAQLLAQLYTCQYFIKKLLLKIQIELIESCILRLKDNADDNERRYQNLGQSLNDYATKSIEKQKEFKAQLNDLKLKDSNLILHSNGAQPGNEAYRPIENLIAVLESLEFDCIPQTMHDFLQEHMGIVLTEENQASIGKSIKTFFINKELSFFTDYRKSQAAFLMA